MEGKNEYVTRSCEELLAGFRLRTCGVEPHDERVVTRIRIVWVLSVYVCE